MSDYITTYSGVYFYPTKPSEEDFRIEDIAHALSLICRGNGQVKVFYSVGEHCLNCAAEAEARGYSTKVVLACLLHDTCECYMSDVPRPFKQYLTDYNKMEQRMLAMVYEHFLGEGLMDEESGLVDLVDHDLLQYDLCYLLNYGREEDLPKLSSYYEYGVSDFASTEKRYLEYFNRLKGELG